MTKCRVCGNEHMGGCAQFFASQSSAKSPKKVAEAPQAKRASVSNDVSNDVSNGDAERVRRWRAVGPNRDRYNAQQRERMRARRAAQKAAA